MIIPNFLSENPRFFKKHRTSLGYFKPHKWRRLVVPSLFPVKKVQHTMRTIQKLQFLFFLVGTQKDNRLPRVFFRPSTLFKKLLREKLSFYMRCISHWLILPNLKKNHFLVAERHFRKKKNYNFIRIQHEISCFFPTS